MIINDEFHTVIGVVVVRIVVEGTAVVVDTIVLLVGYVVIVESIVELVEFDVRNADATVKKKRGKLLKNLSNRI